MPYAQDLFLDLVVAMLAVNRWTMERTFPMMKSLRDVGLGDPARVRSMTIDEVCASLAKAGYARGDYMRQLLGQRICAAAAKLDTPTVARIAELEQAGDLASLSELLLGINGVGPEVVRNVLLLRPSITVDEKRS